MRQFFISPRRRLVVSVAAAVIAVAAGALTSAGWARSQRAAAPAPSTAALNQQYTACIKAAGATWTPLADGSGMYQVNIPAAANARCAPLDLAREAAGNGDASTATWLASMSASAPAGFWGCLGASGYHVPGGSGQRSDYGSADFAAAAKQCAAQAGVTLPAGP